MYTDEEFKEGCQFNLFLGAVIGVAFTILTELGYFYFNGWIW